MSQNNTLVNYQSGLNPSENPVILCTAGYDHTIRFWEALSGNCIHTLQHPESVNYH